MYSLFTNKNTKTLGMQLTITTASGELHSIEVDDSFEVHRDCSM